MKKSIFWTIWKLFPSIFPLFFMCDSIAAQHSDSGQNPARTDTKSREDPTISIMVPDNEFISQPAKLKGSFSVVLIPSGKPGNYIEALDPDQIIYLDNRGEYDDFIPHTVNPEAEIKPATRETFTEKSGDKSTGILNFTDENNYPIPNASNKQYEFSPSTSLPYGAVVTSYTYTIRIDDNGDESTFWPGDYVILLSAESKGLTWAQVYYKLGTGHTDGGHDDDPEDDTDIYINHRSTTWFNGDPADQAFRVRVADAVADPSEGIVDFVILNIDWEAPDLSNLDANYIPPGWEAPMVVNHIEGSHSNATTLYAGVTTYVNMSYKDYDFSVSDNFNFDFIVDLVLTTRYARPSAAAGYYYTFENRQYTFTAGNHTLCQVVDSEDDILESDETDNSYCHTYTWVGAPDPPALTSPANGAGCQNTSILLDWEASDHAETYRLQVDNNSDFSSPVFNQGGLISTQWTVGGLSASTTYYWRVRATNPAGNGSYTSARSFTTAPASAPSAPTLDGPSNGATCQSTTLDLDWNPSSGASTYNLQVDNNSDFSSPSTNLSGLTLTQQVVTGLSAGITYYWRVAAVNACGAISSWSVVRDFTTASVPVSPSLSAPSNGAACQPASLTLSWGSISGATDYNVVVDNNIDFSSPEKNLSGITGTSTSVSGLSAGTTYYWVVRSRNSCDVYSGWSGVFSFTTSPAAPGVPTTSLPVYEATCQPLALNLEWTAGSGASNYVVQLDDNEDFSSPILNEEDISGTTREVGGLSELTIYYWRVKAVNSCGTEGSWSSASHFTTLLSSLGTPVLSGPANDAECQPTSPTLSWNSVTNATGYTIEVDNNADFSSPEYTHACSGNSHNCSGLNESTLYYWRVSASGTCSVTGTWSDAWSFETGTNGMDAPTLESPADNSTEQPLALTLSWNTVSDATGYQFQLDDNDDFSSPLYNEAVTGTSTDISELDEGITYFWQVRATGECATGDWSDIWQFETGASVPEAITAIKEEGYYLGQNYPNPFMETTTIQFRLPVDGQVEVEFMDLQGKLVESLTGYYPAGAHTLEVDLSGKVHAGVYLYRMRTLSFTDTKLCIVR